MARRLLILLAAVVLAAAVVLWWRGEAARDRGERILALVQQERMARVGYSDVVPMAYDDPARGLTGEVPEVTRAVLARMGVERMEGVLTPSDLLITELKVRRFELIASGLEITPERCRHVRFSTPIRAVREAIVVRSGNPMNLRSYADIAAHATARVGVVTGATHHDHVASAGVPAARIRVLSAPEAGVASILSGALDAFAADSLTVQRLVDESAPARVERARPFRGPEVAGKEMARYVAVAFRQTDTALAREFDRHLRAFVGTEEHLQLVRPFGVTEVDMPGPVDVRRLCRPSER